MNTQMNFEYTNDSLEAALAIMEQTVFRKKKTAVMLGTGAFCLLGVIISIWAKEWHTALIAVLFLIVMLSTLSSFRKEYIEANAPDQGGKYWGNPRTLTLLEDEVQIYAPYENPEEILSDEDRADEDYMQLREEMNRDMGTFHYPHGKLRCYESDAAFLLYVSRDMNESILKAYLTEEEQEMLRSALQEKLQKNYIIVEPTP